MATDWPFPPATHWGINFEVIIREKIWPEQIVLFFQANLDKLTIKIDQIFAKLKSPGE